MWIYVDIDGTMTVKQCANRKLQVPTRPDIIARVFQAAEEGHQIIVWSKSGQYAQRFVDHYGIPAVSCVGKPGLIVDNQLRRIGKQMANIISPEDFLTWPK